MGAEPDASAPFRRRAIRNLTSWWLIAAVVVWGLNDHLGKFTWPGAITGKVSDVLGVFALPLLLAAVTALVTRPTNERRYRVIGYGWIAVVSVGFALVKASPGIADRVSTIWSLLIPTSIRADRTDLLALLVTPLTAVAWRTERGAAGRPRRVVRNGVARLPRALLSVAVLVVGAGVTTATSCFDTESFDSVFLGVDGLLYAAAPGSAVARSDDGGMSWTVQDGLTPPEPSTDQQLVPPTTVFSPEQLDERPVDPAISELCSTSTCWRSEIGAGIAERDLATGTERRIRVTGRSMCTDTRPLGAMTLIRHDGRDVLIATNGDKGLIRIEPGRQPRYLEFDLPQPLSLGQLFLRGLIIVAVLVGAIIGVTVWAIRRRAAPQARRQAERQTAGGTAVRRSPRARVAVGTVLALVAVCVVLVVARSGT